MNTTRRIPFALALALLSATMAVPACKTGNPTLDPVVAKIDHAVSCTTSDVVSQLPGIITDVTTDLLSLNYMKLLLDLGKRVGGDVVACAVAASGSSAHARMAATAGNAPNADTIAVHADDYLKAVGATFVGPTPTPSG